jgi:hypothetical protein
MSCDGFICAFSIQDLALSISLTDESYFGRTLRSVVSTSATKPLESNATVSMDMVTSP